MRYARAMLFAAMALLALAAIMPAPALAAHENRTAFYDGFENWKTSTDCGYSGSVPVSWTGCDGDYDGAIVKDNDCDGHTAACSVPYSGSYHVRMESLDNGKSSSLSASGPYVTLDLSECAKVYVNFSWAKYALGSSDSAWLAVYNRSSWLVGTVFSTGNGTSSYAVGSYELSALGIKFDDKTSLKWDADLSGKTNREFYLDEFRVTCEAPVCGDGICESPEDCSICAADCSTPEGKSHSNCADLADNDCDGYADCTDAGCDADASCAFSPPGQICGPGHTVNKCECEARFVPNEDADLGFDGNSVYTRDNDTSRLYVGQIYDESEHETSYHSSYMEWNISSILDAATIKNATLSYYGYVKYGMTEYIKAMTVRPSETTNSILYNAIGNAAAYSTSGFMSDGSNNQYLGTQATSDMQSSLGRDWFALGLYSSCSERGNCGMASDDYNSIGSSETTPVLKTFYRVWPGTPEGTDDWWNTDWKYRKAITVTENSGLDLEEYQLNVVVTKISGKMNSGLSDLRFVDSDGNELEYYNDGVVGSGEYVFVVKLPSISACGRTLIYMYYGNSQVYSESTSGVFEFYDTFSTLNTSVWAVANGSKIDASSGKIDIRAGGIGLVNPMPFNMADGYAAEASVMYPSFTGVSAALSISSSQFRNISTDAFAQYYYRTSYDSEDGSYSYYILGRYGIGNGTIRSGGYYPDESRDSDMPITVGTYHDGADFWDAEYGGSESIMRISKPTSWTKNMSYIFLGAISGSGDVESTEFFSVRVRKYASPAPTVMFGAEEEGPEVPCESSECRPQFVSFHFTTTESQLSVSWKTEYNGTSVSVSCKLNGNQQCNPYPYSSSPGNGGCVISSPSYDTTSDPSGPRTAQNSLNCTAYDTAKPDVKQENIVYFRPRVIEVGLPSSMGAAVGDEQELLITVKNNGTLSDSYSVSVTPTDENLLSVRNGFQSTQALGTNDMQQVHVDMTLLVASKAATANVVVSSQSQPAIRFSAPVQVSGTEKSLPEFGAAGLLQILLAAAALASFLF